MLSPNVLEKCTHSFRRGYKAGYFGGSQVDDLGPSDPMDRPFANYDYEEGFKAGKNDRLWAEKRSSMQCR